MRHLINALVIAVLVGIGTILFPVAAAASVGLLIMAMAVLWMAGVQVIVSRFLHGTEPDLFPIDEPLDDPSESPMR